MNPTNLIWIVVAVALIVWIGVRQLTWQALTHRNAWAMPLVLLGVGLISGVAQLSGTTVDALGVGLLVVELLASIGLGALMGGITQFRRLPEGTIDRRGNRAIWETRTGWLGLGLWAVLIAMRIGVDVWAQVSHIGGGLLTTSAAIVFVIGGNRLARSAVLQLRLGRSEFAPAA